MAFQAWLCIVFVYMSTLLCLYLLYLMLPPVLVLLFGPSTLHEEARDCYFISKEWTNNKREYLAKLGSVFLFA